MPEDPLLLIEHQRALFMDQRLNAFTLHLQRLIGTVNGRIAGYLQKSLSITNGVIDSSPRNLRILRVLSAKIEDEMNGAGLQELLNAFVAEFPGQYQFIYQELKLIDVVLPGILPSFRFKADEFSSFQLNAVAAIDSTIERAAAGASTRGMLVTGGLRYSDLVDSIVEKFHAAVPQAATMADTSMAVFHRIATSKMYDIIQRARPDQEEQFKYAGPVDVKTRPLCLRLMSADEAYTRKGIDEIEVPGWPSGSCWQAGGGWSCRHRWRLWMAAFDSKSPRSLAA